VPSSILEVRWVAADRGRDAVLQVAAAQPHGVEAEPLAELDRLQGGLVAGTRVGAVE
jgi:hypothetical protein